MFNNQSYQGHSSLSLDTHWNKEVVNWPILVAFSNGKVQVRRDVIKQHCYLTLPRLDIWLLGERAKGEGERWGWTKVCIQAKSRSAAGLNCCPDFSHTSGLSRFNVSPVKAEEKKQQNIYTLPDQSFVWAIETVAVCFSQCFVSHVWFSVVTSKSFPRKQWLYIKGELSVL